MKSEIVHTTHIDIMFDFTEQLKVEVEEGAMIQK